MIKQSPNRIQHNLSTDRTFARCQKRPRRSILRVGAATGLLVALLAFAPQGASAQAPSIPGVEVTLEYAWGNGQTMIQMTQPGTLTVRCTYESGHWLVNGVRTGGRCRGTSTDLQVRGSSGDDIVSVDMRRSTVRTGVLLGAGNDTGTLLAANSSTALLDGEGGDDNLRGAYVSGWAYNGPTSLMVNGGEGNDRVRHDGFTGATTPPTGQWVVVASLHGGPGADTILGPEDPMPTIYYVDHDDTRIRWAPVVFGATAYSDTPGADTIDLHLRGTETWITVNGRRLWVPGRAQSATVDARQETDNITIRGGSAQTGASIIGVPGAALLLRPFRPYGWFDQTQESPTPPPFDTPWGILRQPGLKDWSIGSITLWGSFEIRPYSG